MDRNDFEEAVRWAKLVQQLSPSYGAGADSTFELEDALRGLARKKGFEDDLMFEFVEESKEHAWAYDVLNSLVARKFRTRQLDLPGIVWDWAADRLAGNLTQPPTGKITHPSHNIVIADTVHIVRARFGVNPTRNRPGFGECCAEGGSACDIVGAAQVGELRGIQGD